MVLIHAASANLLIACQRYMAACSQCGGPIFPLTPPAKPAKMPPPPRPPPPPPPPHACLWQGSFQCYKRRICWTYNARIQPRCLLLSKWFHLLTFCKCFRLPTFVQVFPLAYSPANVSICLRSYKCFRLPTSVSGSAHLLYETCQIKSFQAVPSLPSSRSLGFRPSPSFVNLIENGPGMDSMQHISQRI